jgi:hypothetical protein
MGEGDLVVSDDPIVEVGDVEGAVGAPAQVYRPEPRIFGAQEIG